MMKRRTTAYLAMALAISSMPIIGATSPAIAAVKCPIVSKAGPIGGSVIVDGRKTWIETVNYPAGGELLPPKSTEVAGISKRHQPLSATEGTSLVVWHKDLNGCIGRLDKLTTKKVGDIFTVSDEVGQSKKYQISQVNFVKIGKYKKDWFRLDGARQLVMITCHGKVVNKHYQQNRVIIATPVN